MKTPRKYGEPAGNPDLGPESAEHLEAITKHIDRYFGKGMVFDEIKSTYVHIDVFVVDPTPERDYITLITSGMSDRLMKPEGGSEGSFYAELMLCLPSWWKIDQESLKSESNWWPFRHLKQTARFPHVHSTCIWYGHTIGNEHPPQQFTEDIPFCGGILSCPMVWQDDEHSIIEISKKKRIHIFTYIPLWREELEFAWEHGSKKLFALLDKADVTELIDPQRESVLRKQR